MAQQDDEIVRLQVSIRHGTRRKLKAAAVEHELEMGEIADAILAHLLPQLAAGKAPAAIVAVLEQLKKDKAKPEGS